MDRMNTGLCLRKVRENSYGRYRRFLLANPLIKPNILRHIPNDEIAALERRFCDIHRIEYIEPPNRVRLTNGEDCIRACDDCIRSGYHSNYFACRWLKYCPIHGREISDTCSECGESWPTEMDILIRNCKTCGRSTKLSHLKESGAFDTQLYKNRMNPLIELENLYLSSHFGDLYSSYGSDETSSWHRSDTLYSVTLPKNLISFYPQIEPLFVSLNVSGLKPYEIKSFDIDESITLLDWSRNVESVVDRTIKAVSKMIRRKYSSESLGINLIDARHLDNAPLPLIEIFGVESLSYSVWHLITDLKVRKAYKERTLRKLYSGLYHLVPTPMNLYGGRGNAADQIANLRYSYPDPWTHGCSIACPPHNLVGLVYKLDLIACFNEVYRYFDRLRNNNANDPIFLPSRESYSGGILMKLKSDKSSIELSFPKSLNALPPGRSLAQKRGLAREAASQPYGRAPNDR